MRSSGSEPHVHVRPSEVLLLLKSARCATESLRARVVKSAAECRYCGQVVDEAMQAIEARPSVAEAGPTPEKRRYWPVLFWDYLFGLCLLRLLVLVGQVDQAVSTETVALTSAVLKAEFLYAIGLLVMLRFFIGPIGRPFRLRQRLQQIVVRRAGGLRGWIRLFDQGSDVLFRMPSYWRSGNSATIPQDLALAWHCWGRTSARLAVYVLYAALCGVWVISVFAAHGVGMLLPVLAFSALPTLGLLALFEQARRIMRDQRLRRAWSARAGETRASYARLIDQRDVDCVALVDSILEPASVLLPPTEAVNLWLAAAVRTTRRRPDVLAVYVMRTIDETERLELFGDPYVNDAHPRAGAISEKILLYEPAREGIFMRAVRTGASAIYPDLAGGGWTGPGRLTRRLACKSLYAFPCETRDPQRLAAVVWMYLDTPYEPGPDELREMETTVDSLCPILRRCHFETTSEWSGMWVWDTAGEPALSSAR